MFLEVIPCFDISSALKEYRHLPHNSLLGLFAFIGPVGLLGFWALTFQPV